MPQVGKMSRKELEKTASVLAVVPLFDYLGRVAVQDSCALLCSKNDEVREAAACNRVSKFMLELPLFR
jgi:hypothetical protein